MAPNKCSMYVCIQFASQTLLPEPTRLKQTADCARLSFILFTFYKFGQKGLKSELDSAPNKPLGTFNNKIRFPIWDHFLHIVSP